MVDAKPFVVPDESLAEMGPWVLALDSTTPLPEVWDGWDTGVAIEIERAVNVDLVRFRENALLPPDAAVTITVSWSSSTSTMSGLVYREECRPSQVVRVSLPGDEIGGVTSIRTTLCLSVDRSEASAVVARRAGSILFEDRARVIVEGDAGMFPTGIVDFASTSYGPAASWHLEVPLDLSTPWQGGPMLLINSRDQALVRAVRNQKGSASDRLLIDQLEGELAMHLVNLALESADDIRAGVWPEASVGQVLDRYLSMATAAGIDGSVAGEATVRSVIESAVRGAGFGRRLL